MPPDHKLIAPDVYADRFHRNLVKTNTCWVWLGQLNHAGYACLSRTPGNTHWNHSGLAHRYSYLLHKGPVRSFLDKVLHTCDNPWCVNPDHLYVGTCADNSRDAWVRERNVAALTRDEAAWLKWMYASGDYDTVTLGKHFGISQAAAYNVVKDITYTRLQAKKPPQSVLEAVPKRRNRRHSLAFKRMLKQEYAKGKTTQRELALRFDVSQSVIGRAVNV